MAPSQVSANSSHSYDFINILCWYLMILITHQSLLGAGQAPALDLGRCQLRAGARSPKCRQSFVSSAHPTRVSPSDGGADGSGTGAGPSGEHRCHRRPSLPSLALDTHLAPGAGQGQEGEAGADTGPFVPCSPRGPAQKPVPTPAPGCTLPSWERKEFRLELGVRPVAWLHSFLARCPWASPSWLSACFPHLQNDSGTGGG